MDAAKEIARGVGGVDLMLVGHGGHLSREMIFVGKTPLIQPGDEGKAVVVIDARLTDKRVTGVSGRVTKLDDSFPDDARMTALISQYKDAVRAANIAPEWEDMDKPMFAGGEACTGCHPAEHAQWESTGHATAWDTLVREKVSTDLDCVPCHVTGFGRFNGFRRQDLTPTLKNVQCEVCHGPGKDHIALITEGRDRTSLPNMGLTPISSGMCTMCHKDHHDPEFNFATDVDFVVHDQEAFRREAGDSLTAMIERLRATQHE
jgi:hypothetical protein